MAPRGCDERDRLGSLVDPWASPKVNSYVNAGTASGRLRASSVVTSCVPPPPPPLLVRVRVEGRDRTAYSRQVERAAPPQPGPSRPCLPLHLQNCPQSQEASTPRFGQHRQTCSAPCHKKHAWAGRPRAAAVAAPVAPLFGNGARVLVGSWHPIASEACG